MKVDVCDTEWESYEGDDYDEEYGEGNDKGWPDCDCPTLDDASDDDIDEAIYNKKALTALLLWQTILVMVGFPIMEIGIGKRFNKERKLEMKKVCLKRVYLLTIVDKAYNEYSDQIVFHSVYQDKALAQHYMLKDIVEQFEKGNIKNIDGLSLNKDMYINNNITWKIEAVNFYDGII